MTLRGNIKEMFTKNAKVLSTIAIQTFDVKTSSEAESLLQNLIYFSDILTGHWFLKNSQTLAQFYDNFKLED